MNSFLTTAAYSYLLGSIPFGYVLVRIFYGQDVRRTGSGNIGATNVSRMSRRLGVVTLILDACKGTTAVLVTRALFPGQTALQSAAAFAAVAGHIFPVWLKFRGGKGVATGLGSFLVLFPKTVLLMAGIFVVIFLLFRYVSLASVLAVGLFPLLVWAMYRSAETLQTIFFVAAACLLIIAKHHQNIGRLLGGTEPRFQWRRG
jgi:acyl phosphate:glycerol-3-phosphate acyltransferase